MSSPSERRMVGQYWEVIAYLEGKRRGPVVAPHDATLPSLSMTAFGSRAKAQAKAEDLRKRVGAHPITYRVVKVTRWAWA